MKTISKYLMVAVVAMALGSYTFAATGAQATTQPMTEKAFQGTLVSVDANMHMLTASGTDGKRVTFAYSDDTKVTGPAKDVEALTGKPGAKLKISYRVDGESNIATRIEVQP